jgi:hypothetical protein
LTKNPVGVEKLLRAKFAKTKFRQDALQTTFLIVQAFCTPKVWLVWRQSGVFQHLLPIALINRVNTVSHRAQFVKWPDLDRWQRLGASLADYMELYRDRSAGDIARYGDGTSALQGPPIISIFTPER